MWDHVFRFRLRARQIGQASAVALSLLPALASGQQFAETTLPELRSAASRGGAQVQPTPVFDVVIRPDGTVSASGNNPGASVPLVTSPLSTNGRCRANQRPASSTDPSVYVASNFADEGLILPSRPQQAELNPSTVPTAVQELAPPVTAAQPPGGPEPATVSAVPRIPTYNVDTSLVASPADSGEGAEECRTEVCRTIGRDRWSYLPDILGDLLRSGGSRLTTFRPTALNPMGATGNVVLDTASNRFVYHDAGNTLLVPGNGGLGSTFVFFRAPGGGTLMQTTNAQGLTGYFGLERVSINSTMMTTTVDSDFDILTAAGTTTVTDPVSMAMFAAMNNTAHWSVPTMSPINPSFINVGLVKQAEGGSPIPRNRVFLNYSLFDNVPLASGVNINRLTPGFELMIGDSASVEVRAPIATTLDSDFTINGSTNTRQVEMGDVTVSLKQVLASNDEMVISGGVQVSIPTASDIGYVITDNGVRGEFLRLENETVHVMPFIGGAFVPNDRLFIQGMVQADFDTRGKPVLTSIDPLNGVGLTQAGRLNDATLLYADLSVGYWVTRDPAESTRTVTGFAPILELHYNRSLTKTDQVTILPLGSLGVGGQDIEMLNATVGCVFELQHDANLTAGYTVPLAGGRDEEFDGELRVMYVRKLGPR